MVALVIAAPVENFMNVLLKVEKAVSAARDVVMVSGDGDVLTQHEKKLLSDSFQQNALLISARPQWAAIEMWMRLLSNSSAPEWQGQWLPMRSRTKAAPAILRCIVDFWCYLIFYVGKFRSFDSLHYGDGLPTFDTSAARRMGENIKRDGETCSQCVDKHFPTNMVEIMVSSPQLAQQLLTNVLQIIYLSSSCVERAHLVGEEMKGRRRRGRAPTPLRLAQRSYQGFALLAGRSASDYILRRKLKQRRLTKPVFHAILSRFRVKAAGVRRKTKLERNPLATHRRKTSSWHAFRTKSFTCPGKRIGSDEYKAEEQRMRNVWAAMSDADKDQFAPDAMLKNNARKNLASETTFSNIENYAGSLGKSSLQEAKGSMVAALVDDLRSVPWGLQLGNFATALKPELVQEISAKDSAGVIADVFKSLDDPVPNPPGTRVPARCCHIFFYGICRKSHFFGTCQRMAVNMQELFRGNSIRQADLPVMIKLELKERPAVASVWYVVTRFLGSVRKCTQLTIALTVVGANFHLKRIVTATGEKPCVATSQQVFMRFLSPIADLSLLNNLDVTVRNLVLCEGTCQSKSKHPCFDPGKNQYQVSVFIFCVSNFLVYGF